MKMKFSKCLPHCTVFIILNLAYQKGLFAQKDKSRSFVHRRIGKSFEFMYPRTISASFVTTLVGTSGLFCDQQIQNKQKCVHVESYCPNQQLECKIFAREIVKQGQCFSKGCTIVCSRYSQHIHKLITMKWDI